MNMWEKLTVTLTWPIFFLFSSCFFLLSKSQNVVGETGIPGEVIDNLLTYPDLHLNPDSGERQRILIYQTGKMVVGLPKLRCPPPCNDEIILE